MSNTPVVLQTPIGQLIAAAILGLTPTTLHQGELTELVRRYRQHRKGRGDISAETRTEIDRAHQKWMKKREQGCLPLNSHFNPNWKHQSDDVLALHIAQSILDGPKTSTTDGAQVAASQFLQVATRHSRHRRVREQAGYALNRAHRLGRSERKRQRQQLKTQRAFNRFNHLAAD